MAPACRTVQQHCGANLRVYPAWQVPSFQAERQSTICLSKSNSATAKLCHRAGEGLQWGAHPGQHGVHVCLCSVHVCAVCMSVQSSHLHHVFKCATVTRVQCSCLCTVYVLQCAQLCRFMSVQCSCTFNVCVCAVCLSVQCLCMCVCTRALRGQRSKARADLLHAGSALLDIAQHQGLQLSRGQGSRRGRLALDPLLPCHDVIPEEHAQNVLKPAVVCNTGLHVGETLLSFLYFFFTFFPSLKRHTGSRKTSSSSNTCSHKYGHNLLLVKDETTMVEMCCSSTRSTILLSTVNSGLRVRLEPSILCKWRRPATS